MKVEMQLKEKFFNFIENGTMRLELRLNDEKRQNLNLGDVIVFKCKKKQLEVRVIGLLYYINFSDAIDDFDISILADKSMTKYDLQDELEKFYSVNEQKEYNVIGIRFEVL